jgi:hypothetical protein
VIALLVVVLALVALPSSAVAAVTVTEFEVEPSSLQAGGHPSVTITQSFQYSSGTDDGKDTFVRLAPGLLGNPQNAAQCTSGQLRTTARRVTVRLKLTDSRKKTTSLRLRVPRD